MELATEDIILLYAGCKGSAIFCDSCSVFITAHSMVRVDEIYIVTLMDIFE